MKVQMDYAGLDHIAGKIASHIKENVKLPMLCAVVRGGMSLAQLVGYKLSLPVGVFYPNEQVLFHPKAIDPADQADVQFIFLEDVLATGRTYKAIEHFMAPHSAKWSVYPSVVDAKCEKFEKVIYETALLSDAWIVFPYENMEDVVEGDRGLFREGTSTNSIAKE